MEDDIPENDAEVIVDLLKINPVLLEKSNTPAQKAKKKDALQAVSDALSQKLGRPFDCDKLKKKI